jgi:hemerythrin-like metal-binding protein
MKLTWDDSYNTGIDAIDSQHKRLFEIANSLFDSLETGTGGLLVPETLSELENYSIYHFGTEESYMKEFGYPQEGEHRADHGRFMGVIGDIREKLLAKEPFLALELMSFLFQWIERHVKGEDQELGLFMTKQADI